MPGTGRRLPDAARAEEWPLPRVIVVARSEAGPFGRGGIAPLPEVREVFVAERGYRPKGLGMPALTVAGRDQCR